MGLFFPRWVCREAIAGCQRQREVCSLVHSQVTRRASPSVPSVPSEVYSEVHSDQSRDFVCVLCIPEVIPREGEKAAAPVPDFRQPRVLLACRLISSKVVE